MELSREEAIKSLMFIAQNMCDQFKRIMLNHGLYDEGLTFKIEINPSFLSFNQEVSLDKRWEDECGRDHFEGINFYKEPGLGKKWKYYPALSTPEYVRIFDSPAAGEGKHEGSSEEKPLPPDGLWIGSSYCSAPVDRREWDVNDSLS